LKVLSEITEKYETEEYSDLYSMFYVYGLMGEVYLELEQWDDSDYCMSKAIDISSRLIISDDFRVRCMYGNICLIKHRLEESEKILTELANDLQYNSKYQYWLAETYFQLGELKLQMYDYAKAEEFYSKAREIYSNLKSAYIINQNACYEKIAEIKFANSDYQGAVKNMEMAIYSFQKYKERNEKVPKEYRKLLKQYKSYI
jgi:tetratricopeptide (TPR) repeat protein